METTITNGQVTFTEGADQFTVTFHRTLRLPEDGRKHALPPSMGRFPIKRVDDYADKVPPEWVKHGGVFLPMWQREAMWLQFSSRRRPFACKVAAGKINAVSGKEWTRELAPSNGGSNDPRQDYMVCPPQPWLDGFNSGNGVIRQFVAMPLGQGYTVEGQVTGKEEFGGIQIMALAPKKGLLEPKPRGGILRSRRSSAGGSSAGQCYSASIEISDFKGASPAAQSAFGAIPVSAAVTPIGEVHDAAPMDFMDCDMERSDGREKKRFSKAAEMGLAQGGSMEQKIYPDPHGIDTWDLDGSGRMYVHIVNSEMYEQITGEAPPKSPITARHYTQMGYPWYKLWDEGMGDVSASETLAEVKTLSQMDQKHGFTGQQDDSSVYEKNVVSTGLIVKDGTW